MRTAAILPVKHFSRAKQRLGMSVADPLRQQLARAMVADVLAALHECAAVHCTIVVTREQSVAITAEQQGAIVVTDVAEDGQSAAATLGLQRAQKEGFERALCVPGDCPALDPAELEVLLAGAADPPAVVIVPDRHGTGTNGLLLTPPDAIAPSFGPGSCDRHRELARVAGVACRIERPTSLLLDIDTGEDLAALRERLLGDRATRPDADRRAARTRKLLDAVSEPWPAFPPAA